MELQEAIEQERKHQLKIEAMKTQRLEDATYTLRRVARSLVKWSVIGGVGALAYSKVKNNDKPEAEEI